VLFDPFSLSIFAMCRSSSPRAYALRKLPCEVTRNIDSFRDFKLEAVIKAGGTPSALAMKGFRFKRTHREGTKVRPLPGNYIRGIVVIDTPSDWYAIPEEWRSRPHTEIRDCLRFSNILTPMHPPDAPWHRSRFWTPFD
jgi:hypothetical protein